MNEQQYLEELRRTQERNWPGTVPRELSYPHGEGLLTDYLAAAAAEHPAQAAIIYYGAVTTYRELYEESLRFAGFIERAGVSPGSRVGVYLSNCPQFHIAFYGILLAGCVHVPLNPMFKETEVRFELEDTLPEIVVTLEGLVPIVEAVRDREVTHTLVVTTLAERLPVEPTLELPKGLADASRVPTPDADVAGWVSFAEAVGGEPPSDPVRLDPDALAALNYTGGTTGMPKGCEHTQRHMVYTGACTALSLDDPDGQDVTLAYVPEFWIAGECEALITPVFTATTLVLLNRWSATAVLQAIERYGVTTMIGPADNYVEMIEHPAVDETDLSTFRHPRCMSFVQKLTPELRAAWAQKAGDHSLLRETAYGMTETNTMDTLVYGFQEDDYDLAGQPVFVGLPFPGTDFKIQNFDTGELVPINQEGEILIRTPSLLRGYWQRPEATAELLQDGWFHTGDYGMIDDDGCLHFLGRRKEMLKVNGMSVFPSELEVLLSQHPSVESCGVIGLPDPERGEVPLACVILQPGSDDVDEATLTAWCRENLAVYKVPRFRIMQQLPMTDTGKIRKGELKEIILGDTASD